MKKKSIIAFITAFLCLVAGASCHVLRISGDPVKFRIGVIIGVIMIVAAVAFGVVGLVMLVVSRKEK